jgi:flagellar FliP-like protein
LGTFTRAADFARRALCSRLRFEVGGPGTDNAAALQFFLLLTVLSLVPAKQVRERDLALFVQIGNLPRPDTQADVPTYALLPAFMISELKTAFEMGFMVLVPSLVINLVVSSVLMWMGNDDAAAGHHLGRLRQRADGRHARRAGHAACRRFDARDRRAGPTGAWPAGPRVAPQRSTHHWLSRTGPSALGSTWSRDLM